MNSSVQYPRERSTLSLSILLPKIQSPTHSFRNLHHRKSGPLRRVLKRALEIPLVELIFLDHFVQQRHQLFDSLVCDVAYIVLHPEVLANPHEVLDHGAAVSELGLPLLEGVVKWAVAVYEVVLVFVFGDGAEGDFVGRVEG